MVFAVDFDGTLSFAEWPNAGNPNKGLFEFLIKRRNRGDKVILWTCREGDDLKVAVDWCSQMGLEFDAVNDNLKEQKMKYGGNSRKVSCDYYIDDRAIGINIYKLFEEV